MGRSPGLAGRRLARLIGPAQPRPDESIFWRGCRKGLRRTGKPTLTQTGNRGYPEPMKATAAGSGPITGQPDAGLFSRGLEDLVRELSSAIPSYPEECVGLEE